jgi:aspartate aminotransferase/aromatic-amino-acid transaminase
MKYLNSKVVDKPFLDEAFSLEAEVNLAREKDKNAKVYNGILGSLCDENVKLVALKSVYNLYDKISATSKAKYAFSIEGNKEYLDAVKSWVLTSNGCNLPSYVIATSGGTGAISLAVESILDSSQAIVLPSIGWNNYTHIASMNKLEIINYKMFDDDKFNLSSFKEACLLSMNKQHKVLAIINTPCHNPSGYSLSYQEWKELIEFINEISSQGEFILLNDIAYFDYCNDIHAKEYINLFNNINNNILVIIAFSLSKTLTAYGLRCGASLVISKNENDLKYIKYTFEKMARTTWSNVNNSAMELFSKIIQPEYLNLYIKEKQQYIDLLKKRSQVFIEGCKIEGIQFYPYQEGFFITLKMEDNEIRDKYFNKLKQKNIFLLRVNQGIRVGICGLSINDCQELPKLIKEAFISL